MITNFRIANFPLMLLFIIVITISTTPIISNSLKDIEVEVLETFEYGIPMETFSNDVSGSPFEIKVHGPDWINDYTISPELVGSLYYPGGKVYHSYFEKDILYTASGDSGLVMYNVSDPRSHKMIGNLQTLGSRSLLVEGSYVYLCDQFIGMYIINIEDYVNPVITSLVYFPGTDCEDIKKTKNHPTDEIVLVAASGYGNGVYIISVKDKSHPVILSYILSDRDVYGVAFSEDNRAAHFALGSYGVRTYDISEPISPIHKSTYNPTAIVDELIYHNDNLYVATSFGLVILGIPPIDPFTPEYVSSLMVSGFRSKGMRIFGNNLYLASGDSEIKIIDITNPEDPQSIGGFDADDFTSQSFNDIDIDEANNIAFLANMADGVMILDIESINDIEFIASFGKTISDVNDFEYSNNYVYISSDEEGLKILDVSDMTNPVELSTFNEFSILDGTVQGDYFIAVCGYDQLQILDISDRGDPDHVIIGDCCTGFGYFSRIFVRGNYAYVAFGMSGEGFHIIDISQKDNPQIVETKVSFHGDLSINGMFVDENEEYLYIGTDNHNNGFLVFDIRIKNDVDEIFEGGILDSSNDEFYSVLVQNEYAYLSCGSTGILIYDVSDPSQPVLVSSYNTPYLAVDISAKDNYLYVSDVDGGMIILDITNKTNPLKIDNYYSHGVMKTIGEGNSAMIACQGKDGFKIVEYGRKKIMGTAPEECGDYIVDVEAKDINGSAETSFKIKARKAGYIDPQCTVFRCFAELSNSSSACSGRGKCTGRPGEFKCVCNDGFYGEKCDVFKCDGILSNDTSRVCNQHGNCTDQDTCMCSGNYDSDAFCSKCKDGYFTQPGSSSCSVVVCNGIFSNESVVCSGHGECINRKCVCDSETHGDETNFYGVNCDVSKCGYYFSNQTDLVCNERGNCSLGECTCDGLFNPKSLCKSCMEGFYGENCDVFDCGGVLSNDTKNVCSGNGKCELYDRFNSDPTKCICNTGFFGKNCDVVKCLDLKFSNDSNSCWKDRGNCIYLEGSIPSSSHSRILGYCNCSEKYNGLVCNLTTCHGIPSDSNEVCSGNGRCIDFNFCKCSPTFFNTSNGCETKNDEHEDEDELLGLLLELLLPVVCFLGVCAICCCCASIFLLLCIFLVILVVIILPIFIFVVLGGSGGGLSFLYIWGWDKVGSHRKFDKIDHVLKQQLLEDSKSNGKSKARITINESLYDDIKVIKKIGQGGSNSIIFKAVWKGVEIGFKCFQTSDLFSSQTEFAEFESEVTILSSIRHPHCLTFYGCTLHQPRVGIVMEFCENGDLSKFLGENRDYRMEQRFRILRESIEGMSYLHDRKIIHRDVKSENILLTIDEVAKIIDFGMSKIAQRQNLAKTKNVGTSFYMAPEVVLTQDYNEKCDIFSFSIVCWEVILGDFNPYETSSSFNIEYKVANDPSYRPCLDRVRNRMIEFFEEEGSKVSEEQEKKVGKILEMFEKSWNHNPTNRPSFEELKEIFVELRIEEENEAKT